MVLLHNKDVIRFGGSTRKFKVKGLKYDRETPRDSPQDGKNILRPSTEIACITNMCAQPQSHSQPRITLADRHHDRKRPRESSSSSHSKKARLGAPQSQHFLHRVSTRDQLFPFFIAARSYRRSLTNRGDEWVQCSHILVKHAGYIIIFTYLRFDVVLFHGARVFRCERDKLFSPNQSLYEPPTQ